MKNNLLETLRAYPGGIAALVSATGISRTALYNFADGLHRRIPWRIISVLAPALGLEPSALVELWSKTSREAGDNK